MRVPSRSPRLLVPLLTAAALVLTLLGAPASADPVPTLTLTAPAAGRAGLPATFTLRLDDGTGTPVPGATVALQLLTGSTWGTVRTGTTTSDGTVDLTYPLPAGARQLRAAWTGTEPATLSPEATVTGQVLGTTLSLTGPSRVTDESVLALGILWRATDGSPVAGVPVTVYRRHGSGAWARYTAVRTDSTGAATVRALPRHDYTWKAVGPAGSWWTGATSPVKAVDNVPIEAPVAYPAAAPRPAYTPPQARATGAGANAVITGIPDAVWRSMVGRSWHRGCPVGRSSLRLLRVNYWGFDGYRYRGEMVLNAAVVGRAAGALRAMYAERLPIRRMYRVDRFGWSRALNGADDHASMRADNTSGFNCRSVVNTPWVRSPHATGRSIDLNTWENPYRSRTGLVPNSWWASRSHPEIAWRSASHPVVRIWRAHGFRWTYGTADSQHVDGRLAPVTTMGGFTG